MKLSLLIFTILLASCTQQSPFTPEEQKQVVTEVEQMLRNYSADIKASGLAAEFKYLDSSEDFFWIPPGFKAPISYDSVARILRRNAPLTRSVDNVYSGLHVTPLSQQHAIYTTTITSTTTDTAGKQITYYLIENGTVVKRRDGWKLLGGQTAVINN